MRLFIAGVLSLVIYLLTCAYGNEERKILEVELKPMCNSHFPNQTEDLDYFIHTFQLANETINPPYRDLTEQ